METEERRGTQENNSRIIEAKMQLQQAGLNIDPEEYLDRHEPRRSDLKTESQKEKLVFIDEDGIRFTSNEKGELCLAGIVDESNENVIAGASFRKLVRATER